jgi:hypothetical protein
MDPVADGRLVRATARARACCGPEHQTEIAARSIGMPPDLNVIQFLHSQGAMW